MMLELKGMSGRANIDTLPKNQIKAVILELELAKIWITLGLMEATQIPNTARKRNEQDMPDKERILERP